MFLSQRAVLLRRGLRLTRRLSLIRTSLTLNTSLLPLITNSLNRRRCLASLRLGLTLRLRGPSLNIRMRRRDTRTRTRALVLAHSNKLLIDLIAVGVDDARPCLVAGFETYFAGECCHLFVV